jgi:hypothetical protein
LIEGFSHGVVHLINELVSPKLGPKFIGIASSSVKYRQGTPRIPPLECGGAITVPVPPPPPPPPAPPVGAVVFTDIDERVIFGRAVKRFTVWVTGELV